VTRTHTSKWLQHFLVWLVIDVAIVHALVFWGDVTDWKGLACAVLWNVAGYLQGRRRERFEVRRG
jgi:hypothetical protein